MQQWRRVILLLRRVNYNEYPHLRKGVNTMVKLVKPKPFLFKGKEKAVLLLHSFTSNNRDVRPLGRYLANNGYTCLAPVYEGHGVSPEQLMLTGPADWWKSAEDGYRFLEKEGYRHIAVIGVSLGGLLALNFGQKYDVTGIVTMSVPYRKEADALKKRVLSYGNTYKQLEGKEDAQINEEISKLKSSSFESLVSFKHFIDEIMKGLENIDAPITIMYGERDEPLYEESAAYIYDHVSSNHKYKKGYPESKHLMTLGKDKKAIHQDILSFLEGLQ